MAAPATTDPIEACLDFFSSFQELSEVARAFLRERLVVQALPKGTLLLPMGRVATDFYFVQSGLLRSFDFDEFGKDTTAWFAHESHMINSPYNYRHQLPRPENLELLEDSVLVSLSYEEFEELYRLDPATRAIGQRMTERQLLFMEKRVSLFRSRDSEQRYLLFLDLFPGLIGRVQNRYLATFLNISPGTVSRILSGKIKKADNSTSSAF